MPSVLTPLWTTYILHEPSWPFIHVNYTCCCCRYIIIIIIIITVHPCGPISRLRMLSFSLPLSPPTTLSFLCSALNINIRATKFILYLRQIFLESNSKVNFILLFKPNKTAQTKQIVTSTTAIELIFFCFSFCINVSSSLISSKNNCMYSVCI